MKRPTTPPPEKVILVFCVECGAMAGTWCTTKTGRRAPLHAARVGVATDPDYWREVQRRNAAGQLRRPELLIFVVACLVGAAIAAAGCGQVQEAADAAQLAPGGASGTAADSGALAGAGGAGGAPIASATGGAAAAGRGGAGDAGHGDSGGAAGSQMGGAAGSAPTCPKVGSLVSKVSGHCWECQQENDAGFVSGAIAGPCEISAADVARFSGIVPAGALCVSPTRGMYPAACY